MRRQPVIPITELRSRQSIAAHSWGQGHRRGLAAPRLSVRGNSPGSACVPPAVTPGGSGARNPRCIVPAGRLTIPVRITNPGKLFIARPLGAPHGPARSGLGRGWSCRCRAALPASPRKKAAAGWGAASSPGDQRKDKGTFPQAVPAAVRGGH